MATARVIVKHTSGLSMDKAYNLRKSVSDALGLDDDEALFKSTTSIWTVHPNELYRKVEDSFFAILNLERFYKKLSSFLGLKALVKGINYKADGSPLTDNHIEAINKFIV